jgi:hypothetical protein
MTKKQQNDVSNHIINQTLRLLSDGIPRSAHVLAQELQQLGINVHKSQINKVLHHQGKPKIVYNRDTYSYHISDILTDDDCPPIKVTANHNSSNGHVNSQLGHAIQPVIRTDIDALSQIPEYQAEKYVESLRMGIPPAEDIAYFTVGRQSEINDIISLLDKPSHQIKLLKANYGAGKTHLLRLLQEEALHRNFAVSLLTLDAKSGIRFNKLDEIFGEVIRNLRVPNGASGIAGLFEAIKHSRIKEAQFIQKYGFYNNNHVPQIQAAIEWWMKSNSPSVREMIVEWMTNPYRYAVKPQQEKLYMRIVKKEYLALSDRQKLATLRKDGTFKWHDGKDYSRTWTVMAEFHKLAQLAGFKGLIILIDEFEDVISNMTKPQQIRAFYNLFKFYKGEYPGLVVFAVTPDFVANCRKILLQKSIRDFTILKFEKLPFLKISSLTEEDLFQFSNKLVSLYEHAYQRHFTDKQAILHQLERECKTASYHTIPDSPRYIAKRTTQILDSYLE